MATFSPAELAALWIGAIGLLCSGGVGMYKFLREYISYDGELGDEEHLIMPILYSALVSLTGSATYFCLIGGFGRIHLPSGDEFTWITYLEWLLTTPLLLWSLTTLMAAPTNTKILLVFFDIAMVLFGVVACFMDSLGWKYFFFFFGCAPFIGIFYFIKHQSVVIRKVLGKEGKAVADNFDRLVHLTIVCWSIYPLLFVIGPNGGLISGGSLFSSLMAVMDIFSKGLSGVVVAFGKNKVLKDDDEDEAEPVIEKQPPRIRREASFSERAPQRGSFVDQGPTNDNPYEAGNSLSLQGQSRRDLLARLPSLKKISANNTFAERSVQRRNSTDFFDVRSLSNMGGNNDLTPSGNGPQYPQSYSTNSSGQYPLATPQQPKADKLATDTMAQMMAAMQAMQQSMLQQQQQQQKILQQYMPGSSQEAETPSVNSSRLSYE